MVLISLIGSPQQKRSIGCPGSYLGCSVAAMLKSKTKVYMLSIRMYEPSSKGTTLKSKRGTIPNRYRKGPVPCAQKEHIANGEQIVYIASFGRFRRRDNGPLRPSKRLRCRGVDS
jgi:hypothetical protein